MRRLFALAMLLLMGFAATRFRMDDFGMLGPVVLLTAVLLAILAAAVLMFDLPATRDGPPPPDSGFGMSEPVGFGLGFATLLLFAVAFLFIAARGLYQGRMPVMGSGPDITFAQRPVMFVLSLLVWLACGAGTLWVAHKVRAHRKSEREQADTDYGA